VPTLDFNVDEEGTPTSPLELGETISGGDIDTVFDWPSFDLTLSNGWFFDVSGESVMVRHEGQAEPLPLQIQMTANSLTETMPIDVPVMSNWVLSPTGGAEPATISIAGNSLKNGQLLPGRYDVGWLILSASSTPIPTAPITYTPSVTATWLTSTQLRSIPAWGSQDIKNADIGINESEVSVNVHGYICSVNKNYEDLFMFLAVTLNNDPEQKVYWLRNNGTKEFDTEQSNFQSLIDVFSGVEECVTAAQNSNPQPVTPETLTSTEESTTGEETTGSGETTPSDGN
jgi:hypothetical protein